MRLPGTEGSEDAYRMESLEAMCMLSQVQIHLRDYCGVNDLLEFKLDTETALVFVSSIDSFADR